MPEGPDPTDHRHADDDYSARDEKHPIGPPDEGPSEQHSPNDDLDEANPRELFPGEETLR
jgi:hypothetical protein